ncbi:MAG: TRAP transporter fused permease subunit [Vicinamibacterales bacterium]|nr:TRAP transporter fused permease subunit [Vicinamibacterales bacterium]
MAASDAQPRLPRLTLGLSLAICAFTLAEVNYPRLSPQSQLAIFTGLGLLLCFLNVPAAPSLAASRAARAVDGLLALLTLACCGFIVWQTEPAFTSSWLDGRSLGNRGGYETSTDIAVAIVGLGLVMEAARRTLGWALPLLSSVFLLYAYFGAYAPDWFFPHRGYNVDRIVAQTFLHTQGVFGVALSVMFTYVFLFVVFGAVLGATGATRFVIQAAARAFGRTPGGPAKVAVISSGLMGSLSGSAVANTAATGTFTIPMMRSAGFSPHMAAGIEAAASSGGALVPPVMGAGAYMMLELVQPPVTYLQIVQAAIIPAILYYLSLFLFVHFSARRLALEAPAAPVAPGGTDDPLWFQGLVFVTALGSLVAFLFAGYTAFRAVSLSLAATIAVSFLHPSTRVGLPAARKAVLNAARDVVPLIAAAACVGIVIGVVTMSGVGTRLPATILPLAEDNLFLALVVIMISSLVLGMGLPSAVTYLLLATLIGPVLGELGVVPLAAHLFIFYFGMMAMVTPPVALAAYAAASIAGADIMRSGVAAFRIALAGFTLPFIFVFRPELLFLSPDGAPAMIDVVQAVAAGALGIAAFAAGLAGYLFAPTPIVQRLLLYAASALLLAPGPTVFVAGVPLHVLDTTGLVIGVVVAAMNWRGRGRGVVVGSG